MQHSLPVEVISLPTPYPVGPVNAYLIDGDEPALVDTGVKWEPSLAALREGLALHGRTVADLRHILITHGHFDHAGAAFALAAESGAAVHLAPNSTLFTRRGKVMRERLEEFLRRCGTPPETLEAMFNAFSEGGRFADLTNPPQDVRRLADGADVELGGVRLRALATPGHAPDHFCFLHEDSGDLLTGDLLLPGITPNPLLYLDPEDDYRRLPGLCQFRESLSKVETLLALRGLPGHGEVMRDLASVIACNRAFIARRLERFRVKLAADRLTPFELAGRAFGRRETNELYLVLSETVAYLDLMEREGLATAQWQADPIVVEALLSR